MSFILLLEYCYDFVGLFFTTFHKLSSKGREVKIMLIMKVSQVDFSLKIFSRLQGNVNTEKGIIKKKHFVHSLIISTSCKHDIKLFISLEALY